MSVDEPAVCPYPNCDYVAEPDPVRFKSTPAMRLASHTKDHRKRGDTLPSAAPELDDIEPEVTPDDSTAPGPGPYQSPATVPTDESPPAPVGGLSGRPASPPPRRRGILDRLRGRAKDEPAKGKATGEKPPKPAKEKAAKGRRESAADLLGLGWGGAGTLLQRNGHVPTGRMVKFQAPIAGELLDDIAKGSAVDRIVLQRLVGAKGALDQLYAVLGPPVYTWQLEQALAAGNERAVEYLEFMLKGCIRDSLPIMLPALKKVRRRQKESNAQMAELLDGEDLAELGIHIVNGEPLDIEGNTVDVADVFVSMLFSDWAPPVPPPAPPQPKAAEEPAK